MGFTPSASDGCEIAMFERMSGLCSIATTDLDFSSGVKTSSESDSMGDGLACRPPEFGGDRFKTSTSFSHDGH